MKKLTLLGLSILFSYLVIAYTPPENDAVNLVLDTDYTAPDNLNVNLVLGDVIGDSCTYSGPGTYSPLCSDNCSEGNIDLKGNNVIITGTGTFKGNLTNYGNITVTSPTLCSAWISY